MYFQGEVCTAVFEVSFENFMLKWKNKEASYSYTYIIFVAIISHINLQKDSW